METKRAITAGKNLKAVIINDMIVVEKKDGFGIYDAEMTNVTPTVEAFDIEPFVNFYNEYIAKKQAKVEADKAAEEKRISDLKEKILACETPKELADAFGFGIIETAGHWSDLYEGRSRYAVTLNNRKDFEIMELAVELHGIEGDFGCATRRDGEHHSEFNRIYGGLSGYQKSTADYFGGDKYFYNSKESEQEFFLEKIKEAAEDGGGMEKIKRLIKDFDAIEDGYYDCNGTLVISDEELSSDDFTSYREDVYSYAFAFQFDFKDSFKKVEEEEEGACE